MKTRERPNRNGPLTNAYGHTLYLETQNQGAYMENTTSTKH